MRIHLLKFRQEVPVSKKEAWDFFSSPRNLSRITSPEMDFVITSDFNDEQMYPGMIITYKLRPVMGIPINWCTEITHVEHGNYFVDEQRFGPYALWHHQHHFKEISGGVELTDILHYAIPFGFIGRLTNSIFVRRQVEKIFAYREEKIEEIFGKYSV